VSSTARVFFLTCPHCRERGELPSDLEGVPALECPQCGGQIRLSANLSEAPAAETPKPRDKEPVSAPATAAPTTESAATSSSRKSDFSSLIADTMVFLKSRDVLRIAALLFIAGGIGLAVHLAGLFSFMGKEPNPIDQFTRGIKIPEAAVTQEPVIAMDVGNRLLTGAFAVLNQFHFSETPEEKLQWVLRPQAIREKLLTYYDKNPLPSQFSLKGFTAPARIGVDDIRRGIVALVKQTPDAADPETQRLQMIAFFKQTPQGIKLDWESYIQAKDGLLRQFLKDDTNSPAIFRVRLTRAHYFGKSQPAHTLCVQLDDIVSLPKQPYVFISEKSALADEIKEKLPWSENILNSTRYATVQLSWKSSLGSPGKRNLVIDKLLCWELLGVGSEVSEPEA
jgi:hypothetical protein